jgi:hypothetical protein
MLLSYTVSSIRSDFHPKLIVDRASWFDAYSLVLTVETNHRIELHRIELHLSHHPPVHGVDDQSSTVEFNTIFIGLLRSQAFSALHAEVSKSHYTCQLFGMSNLPPSYGVCVLLQRIQIAAHSPGVRPYTPIHSVGQSAPLAHIAANAPQKIDVPRVESSAVKYTRKSVTIGKQINCVVLSE